MTAIYSARWYRVAQLKPQLSPQLKLRRQRLRDEVWYLLSDRNSNRSVRVNRSAYAIAARFDGSRSLQQIWEFLLGAADEPPTQDEVIQLLAQLREAGLVQFDSSADIEQLQPNLENASRQRGRSSLLAWRFHLANPSALLTRLSPLQNLLFSRAAMVIWMLAVLQLLILALQHAPTLVDHGRQWLTTPRYALLLLVLFVPVKLLHELAHGLAVRRWGGDVPAAGVTVMLGMPVPWVDASAATAFPQRRQRITVAAAGMMAELALAALALPLWLTLPDGLLRDAAFVTLFMAGVSTLLFNANPLQRLDGYYIATDLLALPNLASRSRGWWLDLLRRRLLQMPVAEPMVTARGEVAWLAAYAPLAWLYSIFIAVLAVAWLGQLSLALGLLAAVLLAWQSGLKPVWSLFSTLGRAAQAQQAVAHRWHRLLVAASAGLVVVLLLPLPQRTRVHGIVWPPEQAQLRADEDGFVTQLLVADGRAVAAGDTVLQLANPELQTRFERQAGRVASLEAELVDAWPGATRGADLAGQGGRAGDVQADLDSARAELERLGERITNLNLSAKIEGQVALIEGADLAGRYLRRGSLLGQVLTGQAPTIRVALPESEAGELLRATPAVSVRLAASPGVQRDARLTGAGGGAVQQLPSAALSQRHGGQLATDPQDKSDLRLLVPVILLDIQLTAADSLPRLGERAWVCFDRGLSPLAWQFAQHLRREFMRRFNPQV